MNISFYGLSKKQFESLQKSYQNFIRQPDPADITDDQLKNHFSCNVFRLTTPVATPIEELTHDDQYAPIKRRSGNTSSFQLEGFDFEATMQLLPENASSLGVFYEHELPQALVFENYLRIFSAHRVLRQRGVLLHSAGLVFDEQAYIFCGRSNAGKTTLARKAYKKGARVLSDDINLVLPSDDRMHYDAYAVPFTGEFGRTLDHKGGKESYPLAGIVLLEQSEQLETLTVSSSHAVARLLTGCPFVNTDEYESDVLFDSVTRLATEVPVIRLLCRKDDDIDDIMIAVKRQFDRL